LYKGKGVIECHNYK